MLFEPGINGVDSRSLMLVVCLTMVAVTRYLGVLCRLITAQALFIPEVGACHLQVQSVRRPHCRMISRLWIRHRRSVVEQQGLVSFVARLSFAVNRSPYIINKLPR